MALNSPQYRPWSSRLHLLVRFVGLCACMVLLAGLVITHVQVGIASWSQIADLLQETPEDETVQLARWFLLIGTAGVLFAIVYELLLGFRLTAARRGMRGVNAMVQIACAALLLVGINLFSFEHHVRIDLTEESKFTLPEPIQEELRQLTGKTTVVVLQQRRKGDATSAEVEDYVAAAESVVVEKVRDFVDQLRQFAPDQFRTIVLDARKKEFRNQLAEIDKDSPDLAKAIRNAPGNSIFFYARTGAERSHLQRLDFDDFYQLDQKLSLAAEDGRGNLVLHSRGVEPLARRVFNLAERRPRVGILAVHEVFTSEGSDENPLGLSGLKKALELRGFEVANVLLKRIRGIDEMSESWEFDGAVVASLDETRYEQLRAEKDAIPTDVKQEEEAIQEIQEEVNAWKKMPDDEVLRIARRSGVRGTAKEVRENQLELRNRAIADHSTALQHLKKRLAEIEGKLQQLNEDVITAQKRESDLRLKFKRFADSCDLLLVPRLTVFSSGATVNTFPDQRSLHRMSRLQVGVVREFLASGKPILACLGPIFGDSAGATPEDLEQLGPKFTPALRQKLRDGTLTEEEVRTLNEDLMGELNQMPPQLRQQMQFRLMQQGRVVERLRRLIFRDELEELLASMGIRAGRRVVVHNVQSAEYAEQRANPYLMGSRELPALDFSTSRKQIEKILGENLTVDTKAAEGKDAQKPRPWLSHADKDSLLRESLARAQSASPDRMAVRFRFPRPIYYDAPPGKKAEPLKTAPEFLWTSSACWIDERPLPTRSRPIPRYEKPKESDAERGTLLDPRLGTLDEKREGPFSVGVAVETSLDSGPPARVVVVGHGAVFSGPTLAPGTEKLLFDSCNWLLRRDDLLAEPAATWSYPRLERGEKSKLLWLWALCAGLPLMVMFSGTAVLLARRVR